MKLTLFILFTTLTYQVSFGQSATIKDPDGWTNVREEPNSNSKVLKKVYEGEFFFWVSPDIGGDSESEWVEVFIPRNKFSMEDNNISSSTIKGYIHRSRIYPIEQIPKYQGSDFHFEYVTQEFQTTGKVIQYVNGDVYNINGRQIYGTDMSTPGNQVNEIIVRIGNENIQIHKIFFEDIFECDNNFEVHKIGNLFVVNQWNSDGAGAYEIVWVLDKSGIVQRLVGTII